MEEEIPIKYRCMQFRGVDPARAGLLFVLYAVVIIFFFRLYHFGTAQSATCPSYVHKNPESKPSKNIVADILPDKNIPGPGAFDLDLSAITGDKLKKEIPEKIKKMALPEPPAPLPDRLLEMKIEKPRFSFPPFRGKKGEKVFHPIIHTVSEKHDVDPALIKAIVMAESSYNPEAVSRMGARGLMQLMPGTAESLGVEDCFNPEQNIRAGVRYFKQLFQKFNGDIRLALAAYNAGLAHVIRYKGVPPFKSTQMYVQKVFYYYKFYQEQGTNDLAEIAD